MLKRIDFHTKAWEVNKELILQSIGSGFTSHSSSALKCGWKALTVYSRCMVAVFVVVMLWGGSSDSSDVGLNIKLFDV